MYEYWTLNLKLSNLFEPLGYLIEPSNIETCWILGIFDRSNHRISNHQTWSLIIAYLVEPLGYFCRIISYWRWLAAATSITRPPVKDIRSIGPTNIEPSKLIKLNIKPFRITQTYDWSNLWILNLELWSNIAIFDLIDRTELFEPSNIRTFDNSNTDTAQFRPDGRGSIPNLVVKLDFKITVDRTGGTYGRNFQGVPNLQCRIVRAGCPRPNFGWKYQISQTWSKPSKWVLYLYLLSRNRVSKNRVNPLNAANL